jgi:hypothetical protein
LYKNFGYSVAGKPVTKAVAKRNEETPSSQIDVKKKYAMHRTQHQVPVKVRGGSVAGSRSSAEAAVSRSVNKRRNNATDEEACND